MTLLYPLLFGGGRLIREMGGSRAEVRAQNDQFPQYFEKRNGEGKKKNLLLFGPVLLTRIFFSNFFPRVDNFCQTDVSPVK